ncbi:MAG TPA: hypothetical protein VNG35_08180 [Gemmatimonadales bacterium]|nr:hypothetical protein [Gemmatimonadales bacterium]
MGWITGTDGATLGPEGLLPIPDGMSAQELHDRLALAIAYLANWKRAASGAADESIWDTRIDQTAALVQAAQEAMDPALLFPGNAELASYNAAASSYVQLYADFQLNAASLPRPGLLSQVPDFLSTVTEYPFQLVQGVANAAGDVAGSTVRKLIYELWPALALAGVALGLYLFWPGVKRVAGSVGA